TIHGLGFAAERSLAKRKFDLLRIMRELLAHKIIELGQEQTDVEQMVFKRAKGLYVVSLYEGEYFRQPLAPRATAQKNAKLEQQQRDQGRMTVCVQSDNFTAYTEARGRALESLLQSPEGRNLYDETYARLLVLYRATEPNRAEEAARLASRERIEKQSLRFP